MKARAWMAAFGAACVVMSFGIDCANAQETGFASIHSWRREGGKTCLTDHFHDGSSSGQPTRKHAELAAVRNWAEFTGWEYGRSWADFRIAGSRSMRCGGSPGNFSCSVTARPCKRG